MFRVVSCVGLKSLFVAVFFERRNLDSLIPFFFLDFLFVGGQDKQFQLVEKHRKGTGAARMSWRHEIRGSEKDDRSTSRPTTNPENI